MSMNSGNSFIQRYFNPRFMSVLLLSFSSGLPLALTASTLQARYTSAGVSLMTIGFLSLVGQPYVWKWIWAPVLDRFSVPFLGRRRGWILITQILLVASIAALGTLDPLEHAWMLGLVALMVATFSATQDIAFDAYRTEILAPEERGMGSVYNGIGYRLAMLVSGGLALILADALGWKITYYLMALIMALGMIGTFYAPKVQGVIERPKSLTKAFIEPLTEFLTRPNALVLLCMIVLYKLGDAFAMSLTTPFLLRGLGFSLTTVGIINKFVGLGATLLGALLAGVVMMRLRLFQALLYFGILQAFSNLIFMVLALAGKNLWLAGIAIFIENFCSGMGTVAFVAFLMSLCNTRYTAAQFALFTALAALGRIFVGPMAGYMVEQMGWAHFYFWTFVVAWPGVFLLWFLRGHDCFSPEPSVPRADTV